MSEDQSTIGQQYVYEATVLRVVDGDTMDVIVDLGFRVFIKERIRLFGIDTPETFGVKKDSDEWKSGMIAKAYVQDWLGALGDRVLIRSHDGKAMGVGKYGRWIAEVFPLSGEGQSINEELLESGNAISVTY